MTKLCRSNCSLCSKIQIQVVGSRYGNIARARHQASRATFCIPAQQGAQERVHDGRQSHHRRIPPVTVISAVIRKDALSRRYLFPKSLYHLALLFCLERAREFLVSAGQAIERPTSFARPEAKGRITIWSWNFAASSWASTFYGAPPFPAFHCILRTREQTLLDCKWPTSWRGRLA